MKINESDQKGEKKCIAGGGGGGEKEKKLRRNEHFLYVQIQI